MDFIEIFKKVGLRKRETFPRVVTIKKLIPKGVKFELTTNVEVFRVEEFGGEEEFTRLIINELQPSDVLYDIGTCVGFVSLHAAKKGVRVISFEPDPFYRKRLETNIRLNSLEDNIKIISWAVSDSQGDVVLYTDGVDGISPSLRQKGGRGSVIIKTDTIDNAMNRGEIFPPDIIKLDIEGAEILALRGMQTLLRSDKAPRAIFMEVHSEFLRQFASSSEEVISFTESFGYRKSYAMGSHNQLHCIFLKDT